MNSDRLSHDRFLSKNVALQIQVLVLGSFAPTSGPLLRFKVRVLSSENSQALSAPHPVMLTSVRAHCGMPWSPDKCEVGQRG